MITIRSVTRRLRRRLALMGRTGRLAAAVLAVCVLAAGAWLVLWTSSGEWVPVFDQPLSAEDTVSAEALLDAGGIDHRCEAGRLLVPPESLVRVRSLLVREGLMPAKSPGAFNSLAQKGDIWTTDSQNAKRWQAAKMLWLSEQISNFAPVRRGTVVYEPGSPRRLGSPAVKPTAAVLVDMKGGRKLTGELVEAIADLVSGSIANMDRRDVRIVDNAGRSYRVGDSVAAGAAALQRRQAAEAYYVEKIRSALNYIDNVLIGVCVEGGDKADKCTGASVLVPRSHFAAICRASGAGADEQQIQPVIASHLPKIRRSVMTVIGTPNPDDVKVDWYYDSPVAQGPPAASNWWTAHGWRVAGGALAALGVFVAFGLYRRIRRRRAAPDTVENSPADEQEEAAAGPFAFLAHAGPEQLATLLGGEHPQTAAMVLANLAPQRAAEVLSRLSDERQLEVARRIANLGDIDPDVVREVEGALARRLARQPLETPTPGGTASLAKILQHAGYQTEKTVMKALSDASPTLAESVQTRLFAFEDIAHIPPQRLRAALASLESDELAIALRTAGGDLPKRVLSCLSSASARHVRSEMDRIGPVRLSDVEAAQQRVVEAVRRMASGEYVSALGGRQSEVLA